MPVGNKIDVTGWGPRSVLLVRVFFLRASEEERNPGPGVDHVVAKRVGLENALLGLGVVGLLAAYVCYSM